MKKRLCGLMFLLVFSLLPLGGYSTPELGIIVGDPTGLSVEYNNFQGALGWNIDKYLHVHIDYLFYKSKAGILDFYVGAGGVFVSHDSNQKDHTQTLGARLPIGLSYLISDVKLRVFGEIVPTMFLIEETDLDFQWGIGVRYVF